MEFIRINRKLFEHDLWKEKRKFSRAEAWIDLIQMARYGSEEGVVSINNTPIALKRGQIATTYRFLSNRWGWGISTIRRFLKDLETERQTERKTERYYTVITLLKYDTYNPIKNGNGTQNGTQNGTNKKKVYKEDIYLVATFFWEQQNKIRPTRMTPFNKKTYVKKSCDAIDKMMRIDKVSLKDIKRMLEWVLKDDFWGKNLLSPGQLRAKNSQDIPKWVSIMNSMDCDKQQEKSNLTLEDLNE